MQISRRQWNVKSPEFRGWHILTVAEAGFSMLDFYGKGEYGLDGKIIHQFADQVNQRDESGSFYPKAPISAIPRRFFRDISEDDIPNYLPEFKRHIREFIEANESKIRARKILIDFHVSSTPVLETYLAATEQVFQEKSNRDNIDLVIILT